MAQKFRAVPALTTSSEGWTVMCGAPSRRRARLKLPPEAIPAYHGSIGFERQAVSVPGTNRHYICHPGRHIQITFHAEAPSRHAAINPQRQAMNRSRRNGHHISQVGGDVRPNPSLIRGPGVAPPGHNCAVSSQGHGIATSCCNSSDVSQARGNIRFALRVASPGSKGSVSSHGEAMLPPRPNGHHVGKIGGYVYLTGGIISPADDLSVRLESKAEEVARGNGHHIAKRCWDVRLADDCPPRR